MIVHILLMMNNSKWANILKITLLKIVEEIEKYIKTKVSQDENVLGISSSLFTSLKFVVLEQTDGLINEVTGFTKKQINELADIVAKKTADILASVIHIIILLILAAFTLIFLSISAALYLGELTGKTYIGFLIIGGIITIMSLIVWKFSQKRLSELIKSHISEVL